MFQFEINRRITLTMSELNVNDTSICEIGEQLANNIGLLIILFVKIFLIIIGVAMTTKIVLFRHKVMVYHKNAKILVFFVHYFALYLLCSNYVIIYIYSLIKFIIFKILIINNDPCLMVEKSVGNVRYDMFDHQRHATISNLFIVDFSCNNCRRTSDSNVCISYLRNLWYSLCCWIGTIGGMYARNSD